MSNEGIRGLHSLGEQKNPRRSCSIMYYVTRKIQQEIYRIQQEIYRKHQACFITYKDTINIKHVFLLFYLHEL